MQREPPAAHTQYLSLRVDPDFLQFVSRLARQEGRTVSQLTRILVREALVIRAGGSPEEARKAALEMETAFMDWATAVKAIEEGKPVPLKTYRIADYREEGDR
jgi:hypothetical protein